MGYGDTLEATRQQIDYGKTVGYPERGAGEIELPGVYDDQGSCYEAYHFIEPFCNARWYGPNEISVNLPSTRILTVIGHDIRRSPALKNRDALWVGVNAVAREVRETQPDKYQVYRHLGLLELRLST